jgi:HAD superfamily hydrolase (TIGR01509 family)
LDKAQRLTKLLKRAKGILFDFDGLLADSERYHFLSYSEVFARYGHSVNEEEYYKYWTSLGLGAKGEIERHRLDLDPADILKAKRPIFSRYCRDGSIRLYKEAEQMLHLFAGSSKRLAIASGSSSADILAVLENAGMEGLFQAIVGGDAVQNPKPAPDAFLTAADAIGLEPADCLVLEDAEKGMFAAIEAGIPVIIIRSPETKDFNFNHADLTVGSMSEFVGLLDETSLI